MGRVGQQLVDHLSEAPFELMDFIQQEDDQVKAFFIKHELGFFKNEVVEHFFDIQSHKVEEVADDPEMLGEHLILGVPSEESVQIIYKLGVKVGMQVRDLDLLEFDFRENFLNKPVGIVLVL